MKKLFISLFIILFVVSAAGFYVLNNLHSSSTISQKEKEQALNGMLGRAAVLTQTEHPTTWTTYQGHAISFSYPSWAKVYETHPSTVMPDSFSFGLLDEHLTFSIEVHGNVAQLADLSGFTARKNVNQYQLSNTIIDQTNCSSFEKTDDGVEESIFCVKNEKGVSFVGSGPDKEAIKSYLTKIVQSAIF